MSALARCAAQDDILELFKEEVNMHSQQDNAVKEALDIREKGAPKNGVTQTLDRRLFIQLQVFRGAKSTASIIQALKGYALPSVLYQDAVDPTGIGVLMMSENPDTFVTTARDLFLQPAFSSLVRDSEMTMFGRTYSLGREENLEEWLLYKPLKRALNPQWPWAIWYPLRRKSEFELLPAADRGRVLMEHARIGIEYGNHDLVHDIRLSCYGMDKRDNEFVLGLVSRDLHPLSRVIQDMRKTEQTAKYIESLGPFFVAKAIWQSPLQV